MMFVNKLTTKIKLTNCLQQLYRHVHDNTSDTFLGKQLRKDLLQKHLDISYSHSAAIIRNNPFLQNLDTNKLEDTLDCLKKMGIKKKDIIQAPMTMTLHYNTVEHNVMYLQEAGFFNITASFLLCFRSIVKKPVALLKAHGVIPEEVNVQNRLFSYLNPKPLYFPLLDQLNDEDSIVTMHEQIFKHYLVWRLDSSEEEIKRIFKTYDKFKYRSFKLMSEMMRVLTKELKFTKQKLLQQSYLFQVNPQYPLQVVRLFPKIAGTDIKLILLKYPKIIAVPPESIATIIRYLKKHDVSNESVKNCFEIFTLCPDTVLYRLNQMQHIPEFEALKENKRFVRLLFNYNKAKLRLDHLQKLKVKSSSINLLVASDNVFEKFATDGYDTNRGQDIVNYLSDVFQIKITELRKLLSHNPHWCQVPLVNIRDSLRYLKSKRFPIDEIRRVPVILLYSRNIITNALQEMRTHPELHKLVLNEREQLNLCLYFIEKKYHFSGDGVWEDKTLIKTETNEEITEEPLIPEPDRTEEIKNHNIC